LKADIQLRFLGMAISEHPVLGTLLLCDFDSGFKIPEMQKRRMVVVISPKIAARPGLCTVVALSTSAPNPPMPYHCQIDIAHQLPAPWQSKGVWVKGDMVNTVGFHRLDFIRLGKTPQGKRKYLYEPLDKQQIKQVRACVLKGLGLSQLTIHL